METILTYLTYKTNVENLRSLNYETFKPGFA